MLKTVDQLGMESALPAIIGAFKTFEQKGERWVYLAFILDVALILISTVGAVIASLIYQHIANRMFSTVPKQAES